MWLHDALARLNTSSEASISYVFGEGRGALTGGSGTPQAQNPFLKEQWFLGQQPEHRLELWEMQILRPQARHTESEILWMGPGICDLRGHWADSD